MVSTLQFVTEPEVHNILLTELNIVNFAVFLNFVFLWKYLEYCPPLKEEAIAELLNHKDSKKVEISFIFKFRIFELKFAAKITACCQRCNLLQNSI